MSVPPRACETEGPVRDATMYAHALTFMLVLVLMSVFVRCVFACVVLRVCARLGLVVIVAALPLGTVFLPGFYTVRTGHATIQVDANRTRMRRRGSGSSIVRTAIRQVTER